MTATGDLVDEATKNAIELFCLRWEIRELSLFGSILDRERFSPASDVDVLVAFQPDARRPPFDLFFMKAELEELFGRKVDLVVDAALRNPFRRATILRSRRTIYAA